MLAKSKLNSIETLVSLIEMEISHEEFNEITTEGRNKTMRG